MILFVGCQGAGKSTFFREHFFKTHVRISLDMLKTRNRERQLVSTCLRTGQRFVVDNTNPTVDDRKRYMTQAQEAGFKVIGYYFEATLEDVLQRNGQRAEDEIVPRLGVLGTFKRLQRPSFTEGFDELFQVNVLTDWSFKVARLHDEI